MILQNRRASNENFVQNTQLPRFIPPGAEPPELRACQICKNVLQFSVKAPPNTRIADFGPAAPGREHDDDKDL
jgi:hypothetical protein